MHRLPNQQVVSRYRFVASLLLCNRLLIPGSAALLVYSLLITDVALTHCALGLVAFTVLSTIFQWIIATRLRCPLCLGSPLAHNGCIKSRHARRLFGSHRLRVAHTIVMRGHFRCPDCGEFTAVEVRRRRRRRG